MGLLTPATARRDKFGEIVCTKLTVVANNGERLVTIGLGANKDGGEIEVYNTKGESLVSIAVAENVAYDTHHGGIVIVRGKSVDGLKDKFGQVSIGTLRYDGGGIVEIMKEGENAREPVHRATLEVDGLWIGRHHYWP